MSNIIEAQKIINTRNEVAKYKEYAQNKVQDWSNIANALHYGEMLCNLLLDKDYVMNLHNLVEKQEQTYTNDMSSTQNAVHILTPDEMPAQTHAHIQEEELSEENVDDCATTNESVVSKEVDVEE